MTRERLNDLARTIITRTGGAPRPRPGRGGRATGGCTSSSPHLRPTSASDSRPKTSMLRSSSVLVSSPARPDMYTAWAPSTGTVESKIATATSGRAATFRECLASGDETPVEVRVVLRGEPDGRNPWVTVRVGRSERHVYLLIAGREPELGTGVDRREPVTPAQANTR